MKELLELLRKEPGPETLHVALKYHGVTEIPGPKSHPVILGWAWNLGVAGIYKNDDMAWCSLAICAIIKEAGLEMPYTGYEVLRAASWANYGKPVAQAELMDILVFVRKGGNHVGFYVGETTTTYYVWGGNQSNRFGITEILKNRLSHVRRPEYTEVPENLRVITLNSSGKISTNEA